MAEFSMTYNEINEFVDYCIDRSQNQDILKKHQNEFVCAIIAGREDDDNKSDQRELVELWESQIGTPSKFLLGNRYIVMKDSVLKFIETALVSGFIEAVLTNGQNPMQVNTPSIVSAFVFTLIDLFRTASKLDDFDFCIYLQAVAHFREYNEFSMEDLKQWFPNRHNNKCNMHNSKWDCEYYSNDDSCEMLNDNHLREALKSLCSKNVLNCRHESGERKYSFRF